MEPATKRGRAGVESSSATRRASSRRGEVELVGPVFELILLQGDRRAAERIGFNDIGAGRKVGAMDPLNHIGTRNVQNLRAILAAQVIRLDGQGNLVDHGPHSPVDDEDAGCQCVDKSAIALFRSIHKVGAISFYQPPAGC